MNNIFVLLIVICVLVYIIYRLYQQIKIAKLREEMAKHEAKEKRIKKDVKYAEIDDLIDSANDRLREHRMRDGE